MTGLRDRVVAVDPHLGYDFDELSKLGVDLDDAGRAGVESERPELLVGFDAIREIAGDDVGLSAVPPAVDDDGSTPPAAPVPASSPDQVASSPPG